ncbi:hypothetical protein LXL04_035987 [Taraxacum kok-saghyz]
MDVFATVLHQCFQKLWNGHLSNGSHPTRPLDDPTDPTSGQHEHPVNSCARQPTLWVYRWPSLIETGESQTHDQSYGKAGNLLSIIFIFVDFMEDDNKCNDESVVNIRIHSHRKRIFPKCNALDSVFLVHLHLKPTTYT